MSAIETPEEKHARHVRESLDRRPPVVDFHWPRRPEITAFVPAPPPSSARENVGAPKGFFLGTHHPEWLASVDVPLFVSRRQLTRAKKLPRRIGAAPWALDSGGFTELSMHGRWRTTAAEYARDVERFRSEVGGLAWAAPQDWMCEPVMLAKTGFSVEEHQRRTIASVLELRALGAAVIPVLQGWSVADYWRHAEAYELAGIDLRAEPIVGLRSVCRRQGMTSAGLIVTTLAEQGIRLHGFGFKTSGLIAVGAKLQSSDSLAWSLQARRSPPRPGCAHASCSNCKEYALEWRAELLAKTGTSDRHAA